MKYEIEKYNPCREALNYRKKYHSSEEAWKNCHRVSEKYGLGKATKNELSTAAAADAVRYNILTKCADICREILTEEVLKHI